MKYIQKPDFKLVKAALGFIGWLFIILCLALPALLVEIVTLRSVRTLEMCKDLLSIIDAWVEK